MKIAMDLLKAEHVGVRDLKNNISKRLKSTKPLIVMDHSRPVKVLVAYDEMVDLLDMLDELMDPDTIKAVQEGRKAIANGSKGVPFLRMLNKWRKKQ